MAVMRRVFRWDDGDAADSTYGWLPTWHKAENFQPSFGLGVAHDFFEHRLADRGGFHEELMAFGAMMYVRYRGGYFRNYHLETLGEELMGLWDDYCREETLLEAPKRACNVTDPFGYDVAGDLRKMRQGMGKAAKEREIWLQKDWWDSARYWLNRGYQQAAIRYKDISCYLMTDMFNQLESEVNRVTKDDMYGYKMEVNFDMHHKHVWIRLIEPRGSF